MIENLSNKISEILNKRFPIFKGTHVSWSDMLSDIHVSRSDLSPGIHLTRLGLWPSILCLKCINITSYPCFKVRPITCCFRSDILANRHVTVSNFQIADYPYFKVKQITWHPFFKAKKMYNYLVSMFQGLVPSPATPGKTETIRNPDNTFLIILIIRSW